ncbi:hypothetical protein ACHHYP_20671 [Achlya hypogyna]|uniref:DDE-1 domain-containing protein n=1 Tax=Achlya hypogyna TaxID=1202772 RepID=A0A1V9YFD6_ACHHY|nr:hypothetical protein ACHHYP_20671 [Achlya hypogyna]
MAVGLADEDPEATANQDALAHDNNPDIKPNRRQLTIGQKRAHLRAFDASDMSEAEYCRRTKLARATLWRLKHPSMRQRLAAMIGKVSQQRKRMSGAGRKEIFPFSNDLLTCMKDLHRARRCLAVAIMVDQWLEEYERTYKEKTLANVMRLCARFAKRHGFVRKAITTAKMMEEEMASKKAGLVRFFWAKARIKDGSVLLVGNFSAHTTDHSFAVVKNEVKSDLYPLPLNTTSAC